MDNNFQFLIYNTPEEDVRIEAAIKDETIWLTQKGMAELLFGCTSDNISLHLKNIFEDDERLKQGKTAFGKDYFKELLERIRSIRTSERRIWQQITDIFAESINEFLSFRRYEILNEHKERYKQLRTFTEDFRICGGTRPLRDTSIENANYSKIV